ncbi:hypothetical protein GCM10022403_063640 [Streptomyces coacervatus]|uniref:Uncharacterized protein n=1 Tax=Streptomyces coacervatus TaxID=647381 RepID=A0ABP7ILX0_9ACTN
MRLRRVGAINPHKPAANNAPCTASRNTLHHNNRPRRRPLAERRPGRTQYPPRPPSTTASPCPHARQGNSRGRTTPPWAGSVQTRRRTSGSGTRNEACDQISHRSATAFFPDLRDHPRHRLPYPLRLREEVPVVGVAALQ